MTSSCIWEQKFERLFIPLRDTWRLTKEDSESLVDIASVARLGWKKFQNKAKVKFQCSKCNKRWTSLNGTVIFHYLLSRTEGNGQVKMWLLRQKCLRCNDVFESAQWYEKEIEKVLGNLLVKVQEKFYDDSGQAQRSLNTNQCSANMSSNHRKDLCEACSKDVCPLSVIEEI